MCEKCESRIEEAGRAAGVPIVSVMHEKERNVLVYTLFLGKAMMLIELPVGDDLRNAGDCASYLGMHLPEAIAVATEAFLETTAAGRAALTISEIEKMLREQ